MKEIRITVEESDNEPDTEQIKVRKDEMSWTEALGYIERAKGTILKNER